MIGHLHVKNIALIEEISIDLNNHLNILTGETGAGKSIIIGSINAVLGQKVSKTIVRNGCDSALIELLFYVHDKKVLQLMAFYGIEVEENQELLLSRKISSNGRSVYRINGQVVTSSIVKKISSQLIDIHGQHEHQSLLNKKNHLSILDQFCGQAVENYKNALKEKYVHYKELLQKREHLTMDEEEKKREIAFLEYEINEIQSAGLKPDEDRQLEEQYKQLTHSKVIKQNLAKVYELMCEGTHQSQSVIDTIGYAGKMLNEVLAYQSNLEELNEQLSNIEMLIHDFNHEMNKALELVDEDPHKLQETEARLDTINHLKMKYGKTISDILNYAIQQDNKLQTLLNYESTVQELGRTLLQVENEIESLCKSIRTIRVKKAKQLSQSILHSLKDLNFNHTQFDIQVSKLKTFGVLGWDDVEFLISTNLGEPLKPLIKVASGGELSRVMLAIKSVLANVDQIHTLIFDEIDAGISGRTAQMVAEKLVHISREHQVICITHLPQIAAMADSHYLIDKAIHNKKMTTTIKQMKDNQSIDELARLIGGVEITDTVLNSAKEMKKLAKQLKSD